MAFIPVPDTVEVKLEFTVGNSETMTNVLHYLVDDELVITQAVADEVGDVISTAWDTRLGTPHASTEVVLSKVITKDIRGAGFTSFVNEPFINGAIADAILPYQVALVATLRTSSGTRGGRGRTFLGGFTEADNLGGGLCTGTCRANAKLFMEDIMIVPLAGPDPDRNLVLGVTSKAAHVDGDPEGLPMAVITRPVLAVTVNKIWDTMRSRRKSLR